MSEKARAKLIELQPKWPTTKPGTVLSVDQILRIFQNSEKYTPEKQSSLLLTLIKPHVTNFDDIKRHYDLETTKARKTPYEAFVKLINNAVLVPAAGSKPQVPAKPTKQSDFDSPVLSSTRVDNTTKRTSDVNLSEVRMVNLCKRFNVKC